MRRVVVIGPESTGKTALAVRLAAAFDVPLSVEYARVYVDEHPGIELGADDVDPIGRGQRAGEDVACAEASAQGKPLVIHDTDLLSTVVYARHYYASCPAWIVSAAAERRADLYLLCAPDVAFVPDAVRDVPEVRDAQYAEFRAALDASGSRVTDVRGDWAARDAIAHAAVAELLSAARSAS